MFDCAREQLVDDLLEISRTKPQCQNERAGSRFYRHWSFPFVEGMTLITPYSPPLSKWSSFSQQEHSYDGDNWQRNNNRRHNDSDYRQRNLAPQPDMSGNEWASRRCGRRMSWYCWVAETGCYWNKTKHELKLYVAQNLLTGNLHLLKRQKRNKHSHDRLNFVFFRGCLKRAPSG